MLKKQTVSKGEMFFHPKILDAYKLARDFAGPEGRVATMPEIIEAKAIADEQSLIWRRYLISSSGEFYGKSKAGNPIVVVAHGIDRILNDKDIIAHSTRNLRENSYIQLTSKQFKALEDGKFGDVTILDRSQIIGVRKYPSQVLNFDQAMKDPLLRARLGESMETFLQKHKEITQEASGNDYILTDEFMYYHEMSDKYLYTGGLLHIGQLCYVGRSDYPDSLSSLIDVADLASSGRFISVLGNGKLGKVLDSLESILSNIYQKLEEITVPSEEKSQSMYCLMQIENKNFVMYEKEGTRLNSGLPKHHVVSLKPIKGQMQFQTIGSYHGLFKYGIDEVKALAPKGANAYKMGLPQNIWENGNLVAQVAPIQFYKVEVDTSKRILQPEEVKKDINLLKRLIE